MVTGNYYSTVGWDIFSALPISTHKDGSTGYVVRDPRNVDDVAARLSTLLGDSATRTSMGMAARARAVGEFDYSVLVARLAAMLQS